MSAHNSRILVTGANGQLGRLVIQTLLKTVAPARLVASARRADSLSELSALGVEVRVADYARPDTLATALAGIDRVLLISSSELGQRAVQHRNVIDAARQAGVSLLAYTSVLHADVSPLGLAEEHRQTEAALAASGLPHVLLRNGWYTENYTAALASDLEHGAHFGSAGHGRIASASRLDYAEAAAAVLASDDVQSGRVYELAGDHSYTLADFAAEAAKQSGRPVVYQDMPQAAYQAALIAAGLPAPIAGLLADSDAGAARDALFDAGHQLSTLIGRPTTPLAATIAEALAG